MKLTTRDFLKQLGLGSAAMVAGGVRADEASYEPLASGDYIADPAYGTCRYIKDIAKFPIDVPSAFLKDGKIIQPARELTCFRETDVVVVGGGPAGFAAALASARTGAKTVLIERYGSLGGLFTNGLVLIVIGTAEGVRGGEQRLVTKGICGEFMERCRAAGKWVYRVDGHHGPYQPTIDPEGAKVLMDRMVRAEKNLEVVFHCWGVDVIEEGISQREEGRSQKRVRGVVFESKSGRQAILAKQVIDCTGDGDVAFQAGADFRQITHNIGFVYQMGNIGKATGKDLTARAADGFPKVPNEPIPGAFWKNNLGPQSNGCSVEDLTRAELEHRENMWRLVEKMRATPGYEDTYVMNSCSQVGVRASRLIKTDYTLDMSETNAHRVFADAIGLSGDDTFTRGAFQIPYRTLLPSGIDNLLVAGRAIGVAPNVIDRVRLIPVCMVTGQAAGTAAALSVRSGCAPRQIDVTQLRDALLAANVCLA